MKKIFFLFSFFALFIFACKKEIKQVVSTTRTKSTRNNGITPGTMNGILTFESRDHLDSYMNFLNEIETNCSNGDDVDLKLNDIEAALDYSSYRKFLNEAYNPIDGFANIDALPVRRYHVTSFQSVINSNFELIVGNTYYNYSKVGFGISCTEINDEKLDAIRGELVNTINAFDLPEKIEKNHHFDVDVCLESNDPDALNKTNINSDDNSHVNFEFEEESGNLCDSKMYNLTKFCAKSNAGSITSSLAGDYKIEWGDGSSDEVWTSSTIIGMWGAKHSASHTYANAGQYTLKFYFNDNVPTGMGDAVAEHTITITTGCGNANNNSKNAWLYPNGGAFALETTIWSDNNWYSRAIGASSYFYKKKNNGNWKDQKADHIEARIEGNVTDANCNGSTMKDDFTTLDNSKNAKAKKTIGNDYSYPIINSQYKVIHNGTTTTFSNDLKTCP